MLGFSKQDKLKTFFNKQKQVEIAYIFGSHATDLAGPLSDYDFALFLNNRLKRDSLDEQLFFMKEIGKILGVFKVDILILNDAPPRIIHQVLKYGRSIFQRSESLRVKFEVNSENVYFDHLYFYEVGNKMLLRSIADGTFGEKVKTYG